MKTQNTHIGNTVEWNKTQVMTKNRLENQLILFFLYSKQIYSYFEPDIGL